jgi:MOSC domain-containing protein YiiM
MSTFLHSRASLQSISVGRPEALGFDGAADPFDQSWTTGIFKVPVETPIFLGRTNLAGDGQADLANHGGVDKAVCAYSGDHYPSWQASLGVEDFGAGAFGENFTIAGQTEDDVCVGDVWSVGDALIQVSQPRQPCWKLGRKWRLPDLAARVVANGRTGWYYRVLREGLVARGDGLTLVQRPQPVWTISAANRVMHHHQPGRADAVALSRVETLSRSWRETLARRGHT